MVDKIEQERIKKEEEKEQRDRAAGNNKKRYRNNQGPAIITKNYEFPPKKKPQKSKVNICNIRYVTYNMNKLGWKDNNCYAFI